MMTITLKKEEIVFRQGEFATTMYEISAGRIGIYANYQTAGETLLATLGKGEVFGEMGLIECYPRSATAVALEDDTEVQEITAAEFSDAFRDKPEQVFAIMQQMSLRLRETTQKYLDACHTVSEAAEEEKKGRRLGESLMGRMIELFEQFKSLQSTFFY